MKVIIDADACSHRGYIEEECRKRGLELHFFCDAAHEIRAGYGEVHTVDLSPESADCALLSICGPGDVVVTSDYGVASVALAKGAGCISSGGHVYTDEEILGRLTSRHLHAVMRRRGDYRALKAMRGRPGEKEDFREGFARLIGGGAAARA